MKPQKVTFFGNRIFADIISEGAQDENHPGFRVGPQSSDLHHYKMSRGHRETHMKKGYVKTETEVG